MRFLPAFLLLLASAAVAEKPRGDLPKGFSLQWQADFSEESILDDLDFTDAKAWRLSQAKGKPALELWRNSRYRGKVNSPSSIALLPTRKFGDFVLEAELLQTSREYGHRDLCLFFGFQDPEHYYYAHFASKTDPKANQVFIVNAKPFTKVTRKTTDGSKWGQGQWHYVRVQRIGDKISVWFDDKETPAMLAEDSTFGPGYIGFGSYNDTGMFANIRIWAPSSGKVKRGQGLFLKSKPD